MSPEEATKFKKQIQYFTEHSNDGMLVKVGENKYWELVKYPNWCIEHKYIIPDEYQDFRMALADGKQLQVLNQRDDTQQTKVWDDVANPSWGTDREYRIKPEPKFQTGQWVNVVRDDGVIFETRQCTGKDAEFPTQNGFSYELWEPEYGNLCVFWDNSSEYIISVYKRKTSYPMEYVPSSLSINSTEQYFRNIAPLEMVKTLKDK